MSEVLFSAKGKVSWFGGPNDQGVSPSEGLAFIYSYDTAPYLFLPQQPKGTTGLARRLDPEVYYVACRWDYAKTPKTMLAGTWQQHGGTYAPYALVRAGDKHFPAWPSDWGPHSTTGRVADISPGLMAALGIKTDDEVEVIYPYTPPPEEAVTEDQMFTPLGIFSPKRAKPRRKVAKKRARKK